MSRARRVWWAAAAVWWVGLASGQTPTDEPRYHLEVEDLSQVGVPWSAGSKLVQRDTLGYLWFFSDVGMHRYNGESLVHLTFDEVFGPGVLDACNFLKSVVRLPEGRWGMWFRESSQLYGVVRDTLCAFDPVLMRAVPGPVLPFLGAHERLLHVLQPEELESPSILVVRDTVTRGTRAWKCSERGTWREWCRAEAEEAFFPLFSSAATGTFLHVWRKDGLAVVHGRDSAEAMYGVRPGAVRHAYEPRMHPGLVWRYDASGEIWTLSDEPAPGQIQQRPAQQLLPTGDSLLPRPLPADHPIQSVHLTPPFRANEIRYDPENERVWQLTGAEVAVYGARTGERLASTSLEGDARIATGLQDWVFLGQETSLLLSAHGIFRLELKRSLFSEIPFYGAAAEAPEGFRSITPWGQHRALVSAQAGLHWFNGKELTKWRELPGINGAHAVVRDTLYAALEGQFVRFVASEDLRPEAICSLPSPTSWTMLHVPPARFYVGFRGYAVIENGALVHSELQQDLDVYHFEQVGEEVFACTQTGLYLVDGTSHALVPASERHPELKEVVACHHLAKDADGTFWISTPFRGLLHWDPGSGTLETFDQLDGLPSNTVYGTLTDGSGALWGSTNKGLFRRDPKTQVIQVFGRGSGLNQTEFNRTSFARLPNGRLLWGGLDRLVEVDPTGFEGEGLDRHWPLVLDQALQHKRSAREVVDVTAAYRLSGEVVMGPSDDFVDLRFAVLDASGEDHEFACRLSEAGQPLGEWELMANQRKWLSGLAPGTWWLDVKARTLDGSWSGQILRVPITMHLPFYRTAWFPVAALAVLLAFTLGIARWRNRRLLALNARLEARIDERTSDLQAALVQKNAYLAETHHRVKNNLQIVSGLLELQASQMQHDLARNEFNLSKSRIDSIALIHRSLYDNEPGMGLDFKPFIIELCRHIEQALTVPEDAVELFVSGEDVHVQFSQAVPLGMICNELITNTLKHVVPHQATTSIHIEIQTGEGQACMLTYDDGGPGLPLAEAFEDSASLGLRLVGRFAHQLKGSVSVDPERKSRVRVHFNQAL